MKQHALQFCPSAHTITRNGHQLQFGLDASTAGIVQTLPGRARELGDVIRTSSTQAKLHRQLQNVGFSSSEAFGLIDDLIVHGILRKRAACRDVLVLGSLQGIETTVLETLGARAHRVKDGESPLRALRRLAVDGVVVVFSPHEHPHCAPLLARQQYVIPVQAIDGKAVVGPIRMAGEGPCPLCADLHRCEVDPLWASIRAQEGMSFLEAPARHAAAGAVLGMIRALDVPHLGPGGSTHTARPGLRLRLDGMSATADAIKAHQLCPLCWARDA
ncbi:type 1 periplasmic-binding domain-containing protein [Corynebacterium gerontici]|uniref:Bacteriocin biosynthesis cyclodehydratase domain protein n=1 Tax=Corynebacterium gerontici TaxID=2079234 RepID=A0A3G6IYY4_9CORY|nr:hypothetical protein [Corynebacterium gerontici]AZA10897.1 hypothetical protein CGERO_02865 [Corynebacterium gerontici]